MKSPLPGRHSRHGEEFRHYIETGMAGIHRRLVQAGFPHGLDRAAFAAGADRIIGDVNYVHPFRAGDGRTRLHYLKQLAEQAGHALDLARIDTARWIDASKDAQYARYDPMARVSRMRRGCN